MNFINRNKYTLYDLEEKIADIVYHHELSDLSIAFLKECQQIEDKVSFTKSPLSSIATAAMISLDIESDILTQTDENINYYVNEVFKNIKDIYTPRKLKYQYPEI